MAEGLRDAMLKTYSIVAMAAAIFAAAAMMIPNVQASAPASGKTDRFETATCDTQGWPYYEASCLPDERRNAGRGHKVRIISTDRITHDDGTPPAPASPYPPSWLGWLPGHLPADETAAFFSLTQ